MEFFDDKQKLLGFFVFALAMSLWICTCMMIISPAKRKSWTERTHIWKYFLGEMEKRNWDQSTPYSSLALQLSTHDKSVEFAHLFWRGTAIICTDDSASLTNPCTRMIFAHLLLPSGCLYLCKITCMCYRYNEYKHEKWTLHWLLMNPRFL